MNFDFQKVISYFQIEGNPFYCKPYGEGHINETYLVKALDGGRENLYILQKINDRLFKDVAKLMNNIRLVTEFMRERVKERGGDPDRESLTLIYTHGGGTFACDESGYFRMYLFIADAIAHQSVIRPKQFYESAVAFGNFTKQLASFDAMQLYETLPDFHNTGKRFKDFVAAVSADVCGRADSVKSEIEFVIARENLCTAITSLIDSGKIPVRVTHNDTKLNNVMLDSETDEAVAVIDLDTVMPGTVLYDFGDSIRFGCNTAAEDEANLDKVHFDLGLFETYSRGYLKALGGSLNDAETENLPLGALLMTFECGMRFLTDYLQGDTYFRTNRPGHNLDRARNQFKLVYEMEKCFGEMKRIIEKL